MNDANYRRAILRITTGDREKLESLIFSRYPYREWGTFFRFGYRITSWGMLVTYVAPMPPGPGELNRGSSIVEFDPRYILRAQLGLPGNPLGIGVIHSHPQGCGTFASSLDNDMDGYFSREFALYGSGRPYISLRMAKTEAGSFAFSGEAWVNGECMPFTELLTTGPVLYRERAEVCRPANLDLANTDPKSNARARELLGDDKVNRIQAAVVAIVGCSGTGSPAAHVLARAGVGYFVLVDPQPFERSNHERFHASTWADLSEHQPKVELIRRLILSINPSAKVTSIRGNVLDEAVLDELLKCDLVLGCTDTQHSRAALSDYATLYLLPCIDSAVLMRAKDGRITEQVGSLPGTRQMSRVLGASVV